jgi:hypothetical protein
MGKIRRLASREGARLAEAGLYLMLIKAGCLLPAGALLSSWINSAMRERAGDEDDAEKAKVLAQSAHAAARRWPGTLCLQRSLLLVWLLRRRGLGGRLRIGVQPADEGLKAHAWVEMAGRAINDSPARCAQFDALEEAPTSREALAGLEKAS